MSIVLPQSVVTLDAPPRARCKKLDRILSSLARDFAPFDKLSPKRLAEVFNVVRLIEMRPGELLQIPGGKDNDYLFIIEGSLELIKNGSIRTILREEGRHKRPVLLTAAPNTSTLLARDSCIICHADRQMLDHLVSWDVVVQDLSDTDDTVHQRMAMVRNSMVFRRLPWECVEVAFERMRTVEVKAGETVIKEGEKGDAYYIINSGRAEVWQTDLYGGESHKIAEIGEGDTFGSEAMISGKTRSETVRMLEDGTLLTLGKDDFDLLISKQMIKTVNSKVARTMIETGYKLLDVRFPEEFEFDHIPTAILIPLHELRHRMSELDQQQRYIIYCQSGNRSAVAALSLSQAGFDVQNLEGGIREWPYETKSIEMHDVG